MKLLSPVKLSDTFITAIIAPPLPRSAELLKKLLVPANLTVVLYIAAIAPPV